MAQSDFVVIMDNKYKNKLKRVDYENRFCINTERYVFGKQRIESQNDLHKFFVRLYVIHSIKQMQINIMERSDAYGEKTLVKNIAHNAG